MANGFRITSIHFDGNEDVSGVHAVVDKETLDYMNRTVGDVNVRIRKIGDSPVAQLPMEQARALWKACGEVWSTDPDHAVTDDIHDSLAIVIDMLDES